MEKRNGPKLDPQQLEHDLETISQKFSALLDEKKTEIFDKKRQLKDHLDPDKRPFEINRELLIPPVCTPQSSPKTTPPIAETQKKETPTVSKPKHTTDTLTPDYQAPPATKVENPEPQPKKITPITSASFPEMQTPLHPEIPKEATPTTQLTPEYAPKVDKQILDDSPEIKIRSGEEIEKAYKERQKNLDDLIKKKGGTI